MITPELIKYIREESAKGKTHEELYSALATGGWERSDLDEAFRILAPMEKKTTSPLIQVKWSLVGKWAVYLAVVGLCVFTLWFYRVPIRNALISSFGKLSQFSLPSLPSFSFGWNKTNPVEEETSDLARTPINCGIGVAPDLSNPATYEGDRVLSCLGDSALQCENAEAVLDSDLFPDSFKIIKYRNSCNFRLAYELDSELIDATGRRLAGQYISCPLDIVKAVDENDPEFSVYTVPDKTDPSKYASQIYFYGTLGLFTESNLDSSFIAGLGCSGSYVDSVIKSYNFMQSNL